MVTLKYIMQQMPPEQPELLSSPLSVGQVTYESALLFLRSHPVFTLPLYCFLVTPPVCN